MSLKSVLAFHGQHAFPLGTAIALAFPVQSSVQVCYDDVTCAARDHSLAGHVNDCDQCDVIDEVDIQEIVDFRLCEATLDGKETAIKGPSLWRLDD